MSQTTLPTEVVRALLRVTAPMLLSPRLPVAEQRRRAEWSTRTLRPPRGTRVTSISLGGVAGERLAAPGAVDDGALLYLHGGGYCIGSPRTHRGLAARLARGAGVPAFVPDYRLAPEHPHPAALEDALVAYRWLVDSGVRPERIAVVGDSAGGGLALALAMALRDAKQPGPAVVAMICPWLDLGPDLAATRPDSPREPVVTAAAAAGWAQAYAGPDGDPGAPGISPLHGDLAGLPPLVLSSTGDDLLVDDALRLARRAREEGIDLEHQHHERLWHDVHALAPLLPAAQGAVTDLAAAVAARLAPVPSAPARGPVRVAIVGGGMSGICMAAKLLEAGLDDFVVYEKASEVGGTWRENTYPGLTCDVPAPYYSYSFAPNPDWSATFAPGPEIHDYFREVTDELGIRERIRFDSEVASARWDGARWELRTTAGEVDHSDVVVTATGVLHHPRMPDIPGLDRFEGELFHSARWDHDVDLEGRRVGVVGTGSTGVQIVTAVAGHTAGLSLFQRTAQWVVPVPNVRSTSVTRGALRRVPGLNRLNRALHQRSLEALLSPATTRPGWQRSLISALCRWNLLLAVRDPELRARLTPDYAPMCKRLVMSAGFYRALQRPGVELVTDPIDHVQERGIVTADGRLHELDVLVLATGFDAHAYMRPMEIVGADGVTLEEAWSEGPRGYRTVALPGFPNLFTMMGPHSPVGNHSLIAVAEAQAEWVVRWVQRMRAQGLHSVAPTQEATARFNEELRAAMPGTIWVTGCKSWYLGPDGLPELWPWSPRRHRAVLREPEAADFEVCRTG